MFAIIFFSVLAVMFLGVLVWARYAVNCYKPKPAVRRYSLHERHAALVCTLPSEPIFHQFRWEGLSVQG